MNHLIATVESIYAAFGRGDIAGLLGSLDENVVWEEWADNHAQKAGVPWMKRLHGRANVAGFFEVIGRFQFHEFAVLNLMAGEHQVAAEVVSEATIPTGVRYRDEEIHLWTFNSEGRVTRFRHYIDSAKQIRAAGLKPPEF